jgi:hypothetical protein
MLRTLFALALAVSPLAGKADPSPLYGHIEDNYYYSAHGNYRVPVLVLSDLGGTITDTQDSVFFQDDFNTYVTISAIPLDTSQRLNLGLWGIKGYLQYYFMSQVAAEFNHVYPGTKIESNGRYLPDAFGGALITYALIPAGSMFAHHVIDLLNRPPPVAKRGCLEFLQDGYCYVITSELAERITEGSAYSMSQDEEELLLRSRLLNIAQKIQFFPQPAATAGGAPKIP